MAGTSEKVRGCSIPAPNLGKAKPTREKTPNPPASSTVKRGPMPETHQAWHFEVFLVPVEGRMGKGAKV